MNSSLRRLAPAACASLSLLATACAAPDVAPEARPAPPSCEVFADGLQAALDAAVKAHGIPGATAAVEGPGCSWRGVAGIAHDPVKRGDLFRIGSITKSFVATAVMMLRDEGRLSLEDPVSAHVRDVPGGDGITVRQILDHTSGLYDYSENDAFLHVFDTDPRHDWKPTELLAYASKGSPYFPPGKGFRYSNTNYVVAGLLIEAVTGRPVAEVLRARLLAPGDLDHTYFDGEEPPVPGLVHGYERWQGQLVDATFGADLSWAWAAGAMVSNGDDLTRFLGKLVHGELLPAADLEEMRMATPTTWGGLTGYGLGLTRRSFAGGVAFGHEGGVMGYETAAYHLSDLDAVIAVLTDLGSGGAASIVDDLSAALKSR